MEMERSRMNLNWNEVKWGGGGGGDEGDLALSVVRLRIVAREESLPPF
jgi:hypothetical protein